jgi:hypothetical protein
LPQNQSTVQVQSPSKLGKGMHVKHVQTKRYALRHPRDPIQISPP